MPNDEDRNTFITFIAGNPDAGDVVPGSGGVRKARWGSLVVASVVGCGSFTSIASPMEKSGCYWSTESPCVKTFQRMCFVRSKKRSKMRKAKQKLVDSPPKIDIGAELLTSVREMKAGIRARVHRPEISAIAHARLISGLSQTAFAALLGVSVR